MGYRSNVTVVFYTLDEEHLPLASLKLWFDENYPLKEANEEWDAKITYGEGYALVQYEDVKWYAGYTHVDAVEAVIATFSDTFDADESTALCAWEFVRTGEETDDIEQRRSDWSEYRLGVSREIHFN